MPKIRANMEHVMLGFATVAPSLLLMWYFHARDRYPEPSRVLWATFFFGTLACVSAYFLEGLLISAYRGTTSLQYSFYHAFVVAALVEETLKLSVLLLYSFRHSAFNELMDGMVYGAAASLGFATLENILYIYVYSAPDGGLTTANIRGLLSIPAHACFGALLGHYAAMGRMHGRPFTGVLAGLFVAVTLHGLYDFPLFLMASTDSLVGMFLLLPCSVAVVIAGWVWVHKLGNAIRNTQLLSEAREEEERMREMAVASRTPARRAAAKLSAGTILASTGSLVVLGIIAGFLMDTFEGSPIVLVALVGTLAGIIPAFLGVLLFRSGIQMLNRHADPPTAFEG